MATVIDLHAPTTRGVTFRIGRFVLDPHRQLSNDGVPVQIGRKSLEILSVLAEAEGALVTKDEMMAAVWPNSIVEENAIQAQIVALRKLLGPEADLLTTVRGMGYRLAVTTSPPSTPAQAIAVFSGPGKRRRAMRIGLAIGLLAVIGVASLWFLIGRRPSAVAPANGTIAVLRFASRGSDPNVRLFSTGLADRIDSALSDAHVPVVPDDATTVPGPAATDPGREPDRVADLLIDGTVEGDGKNVQVSAHLDDTREHVVVWSATFQGSAASPAALQAQVAVHLANIAKWAEIGRAGRVRLNAATLAAFITGRENTTAIRDVVQNTDLPFYQKVVAGAPDFSLGHSSLAAAMALEAVDQPAPLAARLRRESRQEALHAQKLDPRNGEAYVALQFGLPVSDWADREDLLLRGAAVDPGYEPGITMEARLLWATGRGREAIDWLERAQSLNPLHPGQTFSLALLLASEGNLAESRAWLDRMRLQWPGLSWTEHARFWTPFAAGSIREVLALLTDPKTQPSDMSQATLEAWRVALRGILANDRATRTSAAKSTVDAARAGVLYPGVAMSLLARLGDVDRAFEVAEIYRTGGPQEAPYLFLPTAASMRADPRFMTVARRLGLVAYWRKTGHWPDFCGEPGLPYDCRVEAARASR